jgi:membrane protease YdiL (CAAX protease family)
MTDPQAARNSIVYLAIVVEGGLVGLALGLGFLLDQPPLSQCVLDISGVLWGLAGTLPMIGAFAVMTRWPIGPLRSIKGFTDGVIGPAMSPCTLVDLLGISCLAGLGEEMLFRGVLQDALATQLSPALALAVASVLFGLLHAVTASYAVLAALMGAYLGGLYLLTGNLVAPMVTHAAYDFAVLVWVLRGPGAGALPVDEEETAEEPEEMDEDE